MNEQMKEILETLRGTRTLAARFRGFKMPEGLENKIRDAAAAQRDRREKAAIDLLVEAERGLRAVLRAFFRNSPEHFREKVIKLRDHVDKDIGDRVGRFERELERLARSQVEVDLHAAAEAYGKLIFAMEEARSKQEEREKRRLHLEEDAKRRDAEAQRALVAARHEAEAREILSLLDTKKDEAAPSVPATSTDGLPVV